MDAFFQPYQPKFDQALAHLREDLGSLRVGRANPMIVEGIVVEAYGAKSPLKQVASISVPEARTLVIQPWDKSIAKDIEKAIIAANIGINPINEGQQIRLVIPQLTEESRRELTKLVSEKMEKARITIRQIRDEIKDAVQAGEKDGDLTEDDRYNLQKKLDELVKEYNEEVKTQGEAKEREIMTV
jgi:ribosome recycling factor